MNKKIVIFGIGTIARMAYVFFTEDSSYQVEAFTVNEQYINDSTKFGKPVIPFENVERLYPPEAYEMYVAVGYKKLNRERARVYSACKAKGYRLCSYVGSGIFNRGHFEVGENTFIYGNGIIMPFARIGNDVIIVSASIGHDAVIEDHCYITADAVISGHVRIGSYSFVGVNATVADRVNVASNCVIGATALITKDTEEGGVYIAQSTPKIKTTSSALKFFQ